MRWPRMPPTPARVGTLPSDFPLVGLSQQEMDGLTDVMIERSGLEDVLPLSPLQQGLLFHALLDDHGPLTEKHHISAVIEIMINNARLTVDFTPARFRGDLCCSTRQSTDVTTGPHRRCGGPYIDGMIESHDITSNASLSHRES